MRSSRWSSLVLAGIVAAVLATPVLVTPGNAQEVEIKPAVKVKRDKSYILPDEIAEKPDLTNAFDVVKVLRNQWLRVTRGSGRGMGTGTAGDGYKGPPKTCGGAPCPETGGSSGSAPVPHESGSPYAESGTSMESAGQAGPVLYIDEIKQEKLDELKNIKPAGIAEIHYLTGNIAVGRYGEGHESGAIMLKTVKFQKP